jgi:hypothetical protein
MIKFSKGGASRTPCRRYLSGSLHGPDSIGRRLKFAGTHLNLVRSTGDQWSRGAALREWGAL